MGIHVIHHNDLDGFVSAYIFYKKYPDAKFYMLANNSPWPGIIDVDQEVKIFIVDYSFSRETLELFHCPEKSVYIQLLDHHKSAQESLGDLPYCHFELDKCGARLAWEYCFPDEEAPWYVDYTEDQDLWKWELENSRFIVSAINSYKFDFKVWEKLEKKKPEDFLEEGKIIVEAANNLINDHMRRVEIVEFKGFKNVPMTYCNIPAITSSLGNLMATNFNCPFSVSWYVRGGRKFYSLRSTNEQENVSVIAKKQPGGGGHRNAAGFSEDL